MSTSEKAEAKANQAAGSVKETVGKTIGNEQMEAEGKAKNAKGHAQEAKVDAERTAGAYVDKTVGATKETVGSAIGNKTMEAEGKARKLEGDAKLST